MKRLILICLTIMLLSTSVSAQDWYKMDSVGLGHNLESVHAVNQHLVIAVGTPDYPNSGVIIRSTNGGDNWTIVKETNKAVYGVCSWNDDVMVAVGAWSAISTQPTDSGILRSTDGGENWNWVASPVEHTLWDVQCVGDDTAYASGSGGKIIKTTSRGETWVELESGVSSLLEGLYFIDETTGFVVGSNGIILKTVNGTDFDNLGPVLSESGVPEGFNDIFCVNDNTCWVVKSGAGEILYYTEDGGNRWELQRTGMGTWGYESVKFIDEDKGWIVGQGYIKHTENAGQNWTTDIADVSGVSGILPVNKMRGIDFVTEPRLIGWAVGDSERGEAGLILRYGVPDEVFESNDTVVPTQPIEVIQAFELKPKDCPAILIDCDVAGSVAVFEYEDGCPISYTCEIDRNPCVTEYSECLVPLAALVEDCVENGESRKDCLARYEDEYEECHSAFRQCAGLEEEDGGINPDSALWELDRLFENIDLLLTTNKIEKAEKRLKIAQERILETKAMIKKNDLEAAEKSKIKYDELMDNVKNDISELKKEDAVKEIKKIDELEKELEKHTTKVKNDLVELKVKDLGQKEKKIIDDLEESTDKSYKEIKSEIQGKVSEVRIRTEQELKAQAAIVEANKHVPVLLKELNQYDELPQELEKVQSLGNQAHKKLLDAQTAYDKGDYGNAYGQATAATAIGKPALEKFYIVRDKLWTQLDQPGEAEQKEIKQADQELLLAEQELEMLNNKLSAYDKKYWSEVENVRDEATGFIKEAKEAYELKEWGNVYLLSRAARGNVDFVLEILAENLAKEGKVIETPSEEEIQKVVDTKETIIDKTTEETEDTTVNKTTEETKDTTVDKSIEETKDTTVYKK